MGNPRGFLQIRRAKGSPRPAAERLGDWAEFEAPLPPETLREQASRCMDCGIPFCHRGCPLGNVIPDWNDLVHRGRLDEALASLEATNNFPEVTGRVCPAPCEASCVLNIDGAPVTIKDVERALGDHALAGPLLPRPAASAQGKSVAVVGSGPAGLAAAQQLARKGYAVTVLERDDRLGGLLRYGIPDFKLDKGLLDRRIAQMTAEGVTFRTGVDVGSDITGEGLLRRFDAVVLCVGAGRHRPLTVPGSSLRGVHLAMEFLGQQNRRVAGDSVPEDRAIVATGRRVVILGGGDTGSDCLGTSLRQGAADVLQLELMPRPPEQRLPANPWPEWPVVYRTSSSQEEGGARDFAVLTRAVLGDEQGHVRALQAVRVELHEGALREIPGSEFEIPCDLLLLATGYTGVEPLPLIEQLGLTLSPRGTLPAQASERVFAAGDAVRGASLVVWAIAEGRRIAERVDATLRQSQAAQLAPPRARRRGRAAKGTAGPKGRGRGAAEREKARGAAEGLQGAAERFEGALQGAGAGNEPPLLVSCSRPHRASSIPASDCGFGLWLRLRLRAVASGCGFGLRLRAAAAKRSAPERRAPRGVTPVASALTAAWSYS